MTEQQIIEKYYKPEEVPSFFGIPVNKERSKEFLLAMISWCGGYQARGRKQHEEDMDFLRQLKR